MKILNITTKKNEQLIDITQMVQEYVAEMRLKNGLVQIQIPEKACSVIMCANDDWRIEREFFDKINHLMPKYNGMQFAGWTTLSVKASLFGMSLQVIVQNGTLMLDNNQSIYFVEFDGSKDRECYMTTLGTLLKKGEVSKIPENLEIRNKKGNEAKEEQERLIEEMRQEWRDNEEKKTEEIMNQSTDND